jgi:hypothetical protein
VLRAHHVQQVVEHVADLLHLHLRLAVCCLVLVAAVGVVHQVALLHARHLLHEVFHELTHSLRFVGQLSLLQF